SVLEKGELVQCAALYPVAQSRDAIVGFDDGPGNGEAQAQAVLAGGVKGQGGVEAGDLGESGTGVADGDLHRLTVTSQVEADGAAPGSQRVQAVEGQIEQGRLQERAAPAALGIRPAPGRDSGRRGSQPIILAGCISEDSIISLGFLL